LSEKVIIGSNSCRNWIIEASQAENLSKQENPSRMRDFLVSIGSNRRLAAGMLAVDFKNPWDFLVKTNAEARSAEATSSVNLKWWSWGELNPRPTPLSKQFSKLSLA